MRARRVLVIVSLLACAACGADPPVPVDAGMDAAAPPPRDAGPPLCPREGPLDARVPLRDLDLCAEAIVPAGLGLRWQTRSQFLARFGVRLDTTDDPPLGCPAGFAMRGATVIAEASPGGLSDSPDLGVALLDYQVVGASEGGAPGSDAGVPRARTARGLVTVELAAGQPSAESIALVDLAAADLAAAERFLVAIDGIELSTDLPQGSEYPPAWRPERGYALRRLGASIVDVTREGDTLRVRVSATFEPGALERPTLHPGHDLAGRVSRRRAVVRFVVVSSEVEPARGAVEYRTTSRHGAPLAGGAPCVPGAEETALELDGEDGLARAVAGITRFELSLWPDDEGAGDLIREVSVRLRDIEYDAASGHARMSAIGYASNEGPLPRRGMDAQVAIEAALAQWSVGGEVGVLSVAVPIEEGRVEVEVPMR